MLFSPLRVVASFSVFEEMHPTLLSSRVGDLTMKVVDLESRRHSARMDVRRALHVPPFLVIASRGASPRKRCPVFASSRSCGDWRG